MTAEEDCKSLRDRLAALEAVVKGHHILDEQRFSAVDRHITRDFAESDKRYEQRFLAQQNAGVAALAAQALATSAALAASDRAAEESKKNAEKWQANANEWRGAMNDRERNFITRNEFTALKDRADKTESSLAVAIASITAKNAGLHAGWVYLIGALQVITMIVGFVLILRGFK